MSTFDSFKKIASKDFGQFSEITFALKFFWFNPLFLYLVTRLWNIWCFQHVRKNDGYVVCVAGQYHSRPAIATHISGLMHDGLFEICTLIQREIDYHVVWITQNLKFWTYHFCALSSRSVYKFRCGPYLLYIKWCYWLCIIHLIKAMLYIFTSITCFSIAVY